MSVDTTHLSDQIRRHILGPSTAGPLAFPGAEDTGVLAIGGSLRFAGGYDQIEGYVEANQLFTVAIYQGSDAANLSLQHTFTSVLIGARSTCRIRYPVFGEFVRIVVTNTGGNPMTVYSRSIWLGPAQSFLAGFFSSLPTTVQGADPVGAAPTFNPFIMAGVNLAGTTVRLHLYSAGNAAPTTGIYVYGVLQSGNLAGIPIAAQGATAPTNALPVAGIYQAVPTVAADGQSVRQQHSAFGRQEIEGYNRVVGALQNLDVAPDAAARQAITLRASADLAAAGAYDTPIEIPTGGLGILDLTCVYTRGAVGGAPRIRVERCRTIGGVDYWHRIPQIEPGIVVSGADGSDVQQRKDVDYYSTGAAAESFPIMIPLGGADKIRVSARELGVVATPGTLAIYGTFSNRPQIPFSTSDSKAYEVASNSKRMQEVKPLSEQVVWEQLALLADLDTGTFNYPSATGFAMLGYAHLAVWFEMTAVAGGTITLQVQGSNNDVTPTFLNFTGAGYLVTNPAGGGLATYSTPVGGSLNGQLDFDRWNAKWGRIQIVASNDNNTVLRLFIRRMAL